MFGYTDEMGTALSGLEREERANKVQSSGHLLSRGTEVTTGASLLSKARETPGAHGKVGLLSRARKVLLAEGRLARSKSRVRQRQQ